MTELLPALEAALGQHFGVERGVARLVRRPSVYRSSFALEELEVTLDDGLTLPLMFKDLGQDSLPESTRRAKPDFLYDPLREVETYRLLLQPARLGPPVCYGAVIDPPAGRYWLFLERVAGRELYQVGEFALWQQAARWLARFHTRFAGGPGPRGQPAHLLHYDRDYYGLWMRRAQAFLAAADRPPTGASRDAVGRLAECYAQVIGHLLALPVTLLHGEFYASNVLVQETEEAVRVCPVDWEMAAVGPGLIDLAALTAGCWTDEKRTALAEAYRDALPGELRPTPAAFYRALDCSRLHLAVRWLGWSPEWSPPPEHAWDWWGEALHLADRLDR